MITEKMLAEAASELNDAMLRSLPEPDECSHVFSPAFERKMKRIVRKANHPVLYRTAKNVACFILVIVLSFALLMVCSPSVRASVIGWIKNQYEVYTTYSYQGQETESYTVNYELTEVPAGYTLLERIDIPGSSLTLYVNEENNILQIDYNHEGSFDALLFTHDAHRHSVVSIGNIAADAYISSDSTQANILIWEYDQTVFYISGYLDIETLISLAEQIMGID